MRRLQRRLRFDQAQQGLREEGRSEQPEQDEPAPGQGPAEARPAADQQQAKRIVKVRCYATDVSDVTAKMRVIHGSRTLEVEGLVQSDWGDRSTLMCWEITP